MLHSILSLFAPAPAAAPVTVAPPPVVTGPAVTVNNYLRLIGITNGAKTKLRARLVADLRREHGVPGKTFEVAETVAWPLAEIVSAHERVDLTR